MKAEQSTFPVTALAIGAFEQDRPLLQDVFRDFGWRLHEAHDRRQALKILECHPVHVVLTENEGSNWNWKKVLQDVRRLSSPPQLIVASRTADDYLWSEVLNIGGFDVLPQPLDRDELERVVAAAHRHSFAPARATVGAAASIVVPHVA